MLQDLHCFYLLHLICMSSFFVWRKCVNNLFIHSLFDWWIDWLIDRSFVRSFDPLIDRLLNRLLNRLLKRLFDWLIDWLSYSYIVSFFTEMSRLADAVFLEPALPSQPATPRHHHHGQSPQWQHFALLVELFPAGHSPGRSPGGVPGHGADRHGLSDAVQSLWHVQRLPGGGRRFRRPPAVRMEHGEWGVPGSGAEASTVPAGKLWSFALWEDARSLPEGPADADGLSGVPEEFADRLVLARRVQRTRYGFGCEKYTVFTTTPFCVIHTKATLKLFTLPFSNENDRFIELELQLF